MSQPVTYISSDPNGLVSAPIGSFFYRKDQKYFVVDGFFNREEQIYTVNLTLFARKKYNADFYRNRVFAFSEPIETWQKINSVGKTGWKFVSNSVPTFRDVHSVLPTPTPTATVEEPTPTPTDTPVDPTPTPTETPIEPTPTPTLTDFPPVFLMEYMDNAVQTGSWATISCGDVITRTELPEGQWSASFRVTNIGGGTITLSDYFGIGGTYNSEYLQSYISPPSQVTLLGGETALFDFDNWSNWYAHVKGNLTIYSDLMGECLVGFDLSYNTSSLTPYTMSYADTKNSTIRVVNGVGDPRNSSVTTIAGIPRIRGNVDGTGSVALTSNPVGVRVSWNEDTVGLYFCDGHSIRHSSKDGVVTTIAGNAGDAGYEDGFGSTVRFNYPTQCYWSFDGSVYVADSLNHVIRRVDVNTGEVTTHAGQPGVYGSSDGQGIAASFYYINAITQGSDGNLYVTECAVNVGEEHKLRRVWLDGTVSTVRGWVNDKPLNTVGADDWVYVYFESGNVRRVSQDGSYEEDLGYPEVYPICQSSNWSGVLGFKGYELVQWIPNAGGVILPQAGDFYGAGNVDGLGTFARFGSITPI